jgi:Fanconi anemia group M protein
MRQLDVADYVLSPNVAIEFKTAEDFVTSIIDGRIFEQMQALRRYAAPVLMVEGVDKIYGVRNVHPNAVRGALSAITVDFGVPIIPTIDAADSAAMIQRMAEREHKAGRSVSFAQSRATSVEQMQEQVVASLPGIGATLAVPLLKEFGTIEKIFAASEKELLQAEGIGPKRAKAIKDLVQRRYLG